MRSIVVRKLLLAAKDLITLRSVAIQSLQMSPPCAADMTALTCARLNLPRSTACSMNRRTVLRQGTHSGVAGRSPSASGSASSLAISAWKRRSSSSGSSAAAFSGAAAIVAEPATTGLAAPAAERVTDIATAASRAAATLIRLCAAAACRRAEALVTGPPCQKNNLLPQAGLFASSPRNEVHSTDFPV